MWAAGDTQAVDWVSLAGSAVNIGFSIVVAVYLLAKALPDIVDKFGESLDKQQKAFDARDAQRRGDNKDAIAMVIAHCEREAARRDQELGQMGLTMKDQIEAMEELRDAMRDLKR